MEKNWCYTIKEGEHKGKTLWSGRYCCVSSFIYLFLNKKWYILANKRGKGTPDFQGCWCCPCGFLEANESAKEGCARETLEETGLQLSPDDFVLVDVESDPKVCNKGHITLIHTTEIYGDDLDTNYNIETPENLKGGEVDEVDEIKWIPVGEIDKYQWAFNHKETIKNIFNEYIG